MLNDIVALGLYRSVEWTDLVIGRHYKGTDIERSGELGLLVVAGKYVSLEQLSHS